MLKRDLDKLSKVLVKYNQIVSLLDEVYESTDKHNDILQVRGKNPIQISVSSIILDMANDAIVGRAFLERKLNAFKDEYFLI